PEAALEAARHAVDLARLAGQVNHDIEHNLIQRLAFVGELEEANRLTSRTEIEAAQLGLELSAIILRMGRAISRSFDEDYEDASLQGQPVRASAAFAKDPVLALRLDLYVAKWAFQTGRSAIGDELIATALAPPRPTSPSWARLEIARAEGL